MTDGALTEEVPAINDAAQAERPVRVRFAPAPSGSLHVGNARTGLFNWLYARRHGGHFVFRVEDTDRSRATDEAYHAALDVLRWLGLDWDEGPEVGGPYAPYRQSERLGIYADTVTQLLADGHVYRCYCTKEELEARREAARAAGHAPGYDGRCRTLTEAELAAYEREGRTHVVRFRMPSGATTWDDLVRGEITFEHKDVPDFALTRGDGHPLYTLAATVDDVLMGMTHILRGEDLISATPRQLAMYDALGLPRDRFPHFGHLPLIMGADGKPLSKRHGETSVEAYRGAGFLPEAMVNYLALLGWSLGDDRELFTLDEMVAAFDVARVSHNPARFDVKKLEAINGDKIRGLSTAELGARVLPLLQSAGLVGEQPTDDQRRLLDGAVPLVQERMQRLTEAVEMLAFLFADDLVVDPAAAAKGLAAEAAPTLQAARDALEALSTWETSLIEAALRLALVDGLGLKPKHAFTPLRVAVTGRTVSPPLFESMEMLGREKTLARLRAAAESIGG